MLKGKWHFIVIGALLAYLKLEQSAWICLLLLICLLLFWLWRLERITWFFVIVFLFVFSWFTFNSSDESQLLQQKTFLQDEQSLQGTIVSNPQYKNSRVEFILKEKKSKENILVFVNNVDKKSNEYQYGAFCKLKGNASLPSQSRNPGNFDYRKYLIAKGIYIQMETKNQKVECEGNGWLAMPYNIREKLLNYLEMKYSDVTFEWIHALIFGDKNDLSRDIIVNFQNWNLSHLLAISGLHVGLIALFLFFFLTRILSFSKEKSMKIIMILLPFYALFAGIQPPVIRAVVMAEIIYLSTKLNKKMPLTDVLSVTALLFLFIQPNIIYQVSFQFSFLVTFSILLSKKILLNNPSFLWSSIYISFISQLALIPLQLQTFYYISPLSILGNILFVPYFSFFVIPICLIATIFSWFPFVLIDVIEFLMNEIHDRVVTLFFTYFDLLNILWVIGKISIVSLALYYIIFAFFLKRLEENNFQASFIFASILVLILIIEQVKPYFNSSGIVTMLDVGQGDTIIIELPHRKSVIMIDAAKEHSFNKSVTEEENNIATYRIRPFLWSKGITKIDHVILTHSDLDHLGSYPYIMENFHVRNVYIHPLMLKNPVFQSNAIKEQVLMEGSELKVGDFYFYVLNPSLETVEIVEENDRSIVLYGVLGPYSMLFTGDISSNVEEKLIQKYPNLAVDILKVAHHGSKFSTSNVFLQRLKPKVAFISAGLNNVYGHPAKEVIERLENNQVMFFRTDKSGAISYKFAGDSVTFYPWIP